MTIQFSRTSADNTVLTAADAPQLSFAADADFALGVVIAFNGDMTVAAGSGQYQTLFRTGDFSTVGSIIAMWEASDYASGTKNGKFYFNVSNSSNTRCTSPVAVEAGESYLLVLQRQAGNLVSKLCPILAAVPADGADVLTSAPYAFPGALDGPAGLIFGNNSVSSRRLDQSLARFFRVERALTDHEIGQLAYGKEITAFAAPSIYIRMNDPADIVDTGTQANALTVGTFTAGADPGFGFSSVPTAPTFESAPIISGAAVVGTPVGYTAGLALGNPAPTITRQWTLDGVNISGATGATYTPVAGDAGKSLRVALTATNGVNPAATSTSAPAVVSSTTVDLTLTSIAAERIFQRAAGAANVPLSGAFVGAAPAKIEAQIYSADGADIVRAWFDVAATFGSGTWSASPAISAPTDGRKYRVQVRSKNAGGGIIVTAPMSARFGVGDVILVIGSSSPSTWFMGGSGFNKTPNHEKVSALYSSTAPWSLFDDTGQASGMAEHFANQTGVPTALCNIALGGTNLAQWASTASAEWGRFTAIMANIGGKLAGLFGSAGSNDIVSASSALTVADHLAKLRAVATNYRAHLGQPNLPVLWSGINRRYDALELQANNARAAEREFGQDANVHYVQTLDIQVNGPDEGGDGVHPTGAGYATCCNRIKYVWTEGVIEGTPVRGPRITGIAYSGTKATITVEHRNGGNDLVPATGATGFAVTDDSGEAGIVSVERVDGTRITLTCDRVLVNPKITYLAGAWVDNAAPVFDNAATALPMMAEPFAVAGAGAVVSSFSKTFTLTWDVAGVGGVTPPPDTTAPVLSGAITESNVTESGFTFAWPAATGDVVGYESSIDGGASWLDAGTARSRTVAGRAASTAHACRARAYDGASPRNLSAALSRTITTLAAQNPDTDPALAFTPSTARTIQVLPTGVAFSAAAGSFWNMSDPKKPRAPKDPQETIDITFDWTAWMDDCQDSIVDELFTVGGELVKVASDTIGMKSTIFLGAGALTNPVTRAPVTCQVTTSSIPPRTAERTIYLDIEDR